MLLRKTLNISKSCFVIVLFVLTALPLSAQYFNEGQNSWRVKWRQIKTTDFQLIYPKQYEEKAQRVANYLDAIIKVSRKNLKSKPKKISIILQTQTTRANGFATLAPRRSEFYTVPPQENEGVNWIELLAIHEYRHVVQMDKMNEGIGKVLYYMFGEQGVGGLLGLTLPLWWLEGDAVDFETNYSSLGRGKYADFIQEMNAQIAAKDSFSYDKAMFGSYKDFVTNHYKLGYYLAAYTRVKYGTEVWDSVLHCVARNPFVPYPFSYHLKRITGKTTNSLYADFYHFSDSVWEAKKINNTTCDTLTKRATGFADYRFPHLYKDRIICLKRSYNKVYTIVEIDSSGKEKVLHTPGRIDDNSFTVNDGKAFWAEKRNHPRWQYKDYSEIISFDLEKHKRKRLNRRTRWFAPSLSPDGSTVVCIEVDEKEKVHLVFYIIAQKAINRIPLTYGMAYHPSWIDNKSVVLVQQQGGFNRITKVDLSGNKDVVYETEEELSYPKSIGNESYVVNSTYQNRNAILKVSTFGDVEMMVTHKLGVKFPFYDSRNKKVIYSQYTSQGYQICKSDFKPQFVISGAMSSTEVLPKNIASQNGSYNILGSSLDSLKAYKSKKYYPLLHLFNIHSWAPISIDPSAETAGIGASFFSQNKLSSSTFSLNYDYDYFTSDNFLNAAYKFERYFPTFSVQYLKGWNNNYKIQGETADLLQDHFIANIGLDLNLTHNNYNKRLALTGSFVNSKLDLHVKTVEYDTVIHRNLLSYNFVYSSQYFRAKKNITPRWGIVLNGRFEHLPTKTDSSSIIGALDFYVPGLLPNHGLKIKNEFMMRDTSLLFSTRIKFPRGYPVEAIHRGYFFSAEYFFPIFYPDWKLSKIAYIQRLYGSVFFDHLLTNEQVRNFNTDRFLIANENDVLSSFGFTLRVDFNGLRYAYPMNAGIDIAFRKENNNYIPIFAPTFSFSY